MKSSFYYSLHPTGMFLANCIVLGDTSTQEFILIDCGGDISSALNDADKHGLKKCTEIVCTHGHIDHIAGLEQAVLKTNAPISLHSQDLQLYNIAPLQAMLFGLQLQPLPTVKRILEDQDRIYVGQYEGVVLHTPGHSPGSICIYFEEPKILVTGDTIYNGNVGSSVLPGGDTAKLKLSVLSVLNNTKPESIILPGHGIASTVSKEKQTSTIYYM
ncbi:beta lactamase domain, putative [Entamoeba dispar SAW760]|uniref:Beta lactamase domain, putative n=1 Tax=Entamoeba dispar (strain ATCC PRA-260 / SAW760) TaxID=370354 RepID=B0ETH9_ENTDS|nr:beta lactamase domain, putative [Entamoeba dispar SAW760]EDR22164.1 beta lactamase domain, putative [Entamoeba dispar SAW760]|eukprot:EDR22164.1 beta lactamase domain, putative [Entamoeba dispar SAW760]